MKKTDSFAVIIVLFFSILILRVSTSSVHAIPDLIITSPSEVNEGSVFHVTITSNTIAVDNVSVFFNGELKITNATGVLPFYAPRVLPEENNSFSLYATKEGFSSANWTISVLNVPQLLPSVNSNYLTENTTFLLSVIDDRGRSIENATIIYEKKEYLTDKNGSVQLQTPAVRKSETYRIEIQKTGYLSNYIIVVVSPRPSQENLLGIGLLLWVCVIIVVVSLVLVAAKVIKERRINRR